MSSTAAIFSLVVDRKATRGDPATAVEAAFRGGADWLHIRERELEGRELLGFARALAAAARRGARSAGRPCKVIVNRWLDAALILEADGVHLGFDAVTPRDARALLGEGATIGVSTHSPGEVSAARDSGANYVHLAPIFDPLSKPASRPPLGIAAVEGARACGVPVLAQGGVEPTHCRGLIEAGAAGIAVTGSVLASETPEAAARSLREQLDSSVSSAWRR